MQKTTTEIVDEVLSNIYANGRGMRNAKSDELASNNTVCVYYDDTTQVMCAVGQCMINPKEAEDEAIGAISDYFWATADDLGLEDTEELIGENHSFINLDERLRPEFRGHDWYFWSALQDLHDTHSHWEEDNSEEKKVKLTKKGQEKLEELKSEWCTNA